MRNEVFWELVAMYGRKDISTEDAMSVIVGDTNSYEVAIADFSLLVKRTVTPEEKLKIKELLKERESKKSNS